jgi:acetyl-CoA carboxylase biotin carboxyl carrier protein
VGVTDDNDMIDDSDDLARARQAGDDADYAALVRGLARDLSPTSITRLEVRHGDLRVSLRRTPGAIPAAFAPMMAQSVEAPARPVEWRAVVAPLTGIFYARPSPDEEPYVSVGGHVEPDSIVGLIETMKMFNEVTADIAGTVHEIAFENGALVEVGQPLVYIEPGESMAGPPTSV